VLRSSPDFPAKFRKTKKKVEKIEKKRKIKVQRKERGKG